MPQQRVELVHDVVERALVPGPRPLQASGEAFVTIDPTRARRGGGRAHRRGGHDVGRQAASAAAARARVATGAICSSAPGAAATSMAWAIRAARTAAANDVPLHRANPPSTAPPAEK